MGDIIFQLNKEKTEVLVCAPDRFMSKVMETLDGFAIFAKSFSCGVTRLTLEVHISGLLLLLISYEILPC